MVIALVSGSSSLALRPGWGHCVVFLVGGGGGGKKHPLPFYSKKHAITPPP